MYNSNIPSYRDLPSTKQLLISTLGAGIFAAIVLITTILPAEYGIDPTGIGQTLGLTQMGEIKASLAYEARHAKEKKTASKSLQSSQSSQEVPTAETTSKTDVANATPLKQDQRHITLAPGAAAEVKMAMRKDAKVSFTWTTEGGPVNFDTHGDNHMTEYHGYNKGRSVNGDSGELIAAFDGNHGWYWRNRSDQTVIVNLTTEGEYKVIARIL